MRLIAHLSDLHFGASDPALVRAVRAKLEALQPHVTVVSGDLTQRARRTEFRAAREFLDALPGKKLVVPGNHDVPLWNLFARFLEPLTGYSRFISSDLAPLLLDDEVALVGINTARSWTRKGGRINQEQVEVACRELACAAPDAIRIVVTHHPFDLAETHGPNELVGRAQMALTHLATAGADLLLAGHFHEAYTGGTSHRYPLGGYSALVVQAGTATSTRTRGSPNSFNLLHLEGATVALEILNWNPGTSRFEIHERKQYRRDPQSGFVRLPLPMEATVQPPPI